LPKKAEILPKPDIKVFKEKEKKNSQLIEDIINKKVAFLLVRNKSELKNSNSIVKLNKVMTNIHPSKVNSAKCNNSEINLLNSRSKEIN